MERVAYIQADRNGEAYSANGAVAAKGFAILGYSIHYFKPEEVESLTLSEDTIVVGGVGTVRKALATLEARSVYHVSIPSELRPYAGREYWRTTFGEVLEAERYPIFLKPYEDAKTFTGKVVRDAKEVQQFLVPRENFPFLSRDSEVMAQEPVVFVSEWRVFVIRGVPVGTSHYLGDPLVFPVAAIIRAAIGAYQNAPAGCSLDFGVTDDGRTLLIETNDGYSLGHGGLTAVGYAELLRARWEEMTSET